MKTKRGLNKRLIFRSLRQCGRALNLFDQIAANGKGECAWRKFWATSRRILTVNRFLPGPLFKLFVYPSAGPIASPKSLICNGLTNSTPTTQQDHCSGNKLHAEIRSSAVTSFLGYQRIPPPPGSCANQFTARGISADDYLVGIWLLSSAMPASCLKLITLI